MSPVASFIVESFSSLTLVSNALVAVLLIIFVLSKVIPKEKNIKKIVTLISNNYLIGIFLVSAVATVGSLSLSEVAFFAPCKLCWYQRAMMYPIAVISFVGLISNDSKVRKYIIPLSLIGVVIAGYHILVQLFPQALECSDEVAKCAAVEFAQFGYITIPVMAFSAFLLIILLTLFPSNKSK